MHISGPNVLFQQVLSQVLHVLCSVELEINASMHHKRDDTVAC